MTEACVASLAGSVARQENNDTLRTVVSGLARTTDEISISRLLNTNSSDIL